MDVAVNTVLHTKRVEVEQQPDVKARQLQIGQHLRRVNGHNPRNSFELDDDLPFDQQVDAIPAVDAHTAILDR